MEALKNGTRVRVVDPQSPWSGRVGEVIGWNVSLALVRFQAELGTHDRYLAADQIAVEFDRKFDEARRAQGFKSQAHLDAFFRAYDHTSTCPTCTAHAGNVELSDGPQPYLGRCDEGRRLETESFAFLQAVQS